MVSSRNRASVSARFGATPFRNWPLGGGVEDRGGRGGRLLQPLALAQTFLGAALPRRLDVEREVREHRPQPPERRAAGPALGGGAVDQREDPLRRQRVWGQA